MAFSRPFTYTVGTSASNLVQLDGSAKLPAVDGSQLTNLPGSGFSPTITSPASGQGIRYNGSSWVNSAIQASDVPDGFGPSPRILLWSLGGVCGAMPDAITDTTASFSANLLIFIPLWLPTMTLNDLRIECTTPAASGKARIGIYSCDATTKLPKTLLAGGTELDMSTTGHKSQSPGVAITQGFYWGCYLCNSGSITVRGNGKACTLGWGKTTYAWYDNVQKSQTYGALPSDAGGSSTTGFSLVENNRPNIRWGQ